METSLGDMFLEMIFGHLKDNFPQTMADFRSISSFGDGQFWPMKYPL